ncbi:MAG: hypothetical protein J4400_02095 [Candidatus Aenigmarchaeota archaeon]|nr:hypothetical protein [Candidatus Aenigmarchaeota archaeon]
MEEPRVIIYADKREGNSRILDILKDRCDLREKQLAVADYLLSKRVAVERKTCGDFISSITDGRLFRQLNELKENFKMPLMILEGNGLFSGERKVHPNAIRGALASITLDYGIPVIKTENNLDTAEMLLAIAKREQLERKKNISLRGGKKAKSTNHRQEFILAGLPQISTQTARKLLKHFGTLEKIFTSTEEELTGIEGIGPKTAKMIRTLLTKKYEKSILDD